MAELVSVPSAGDDLDAQEGGAAGEERARPREYAGPFLDHGGLGKALRDGRSHGRSGSVERSIYTTTADVEVQARHVRVVEDLGGVQL